MLQRPPQCLHPPFSVLTLLSCPASVCLTLTSQVSPRRFPWYYRETANAVTTRRQLQGGSLIISHSKWWHSVLVQLGLCKTIKSQAQLLLAISKLEFITGQRWLLHYPTLNTFFYMQIITDRLDLEDLILLIPSCCRIFVDCWLSD